MPQPNAILARLGRYRSTLLGALLVVALAVTGVVTLQAYRASRNYKAIVERVLHDYVATAAYQYQQDVSTAMNGCVNALFSSLTDPTNGKVSPQDLTLCNNTTRDYFEYDYATGKFDLHGASVPASVLEQVKTRAFSDKLGHARYNWYSGALVPPSDTTHVLAYVIKVDERHRPLRLVAVMTRGVTKMVGDAVLAESRLLAPDLAGGSPNNWRASIVPNVPAESTRSTYSARTPLVPPYDDLAVDVELKQEGRAAIVPNGIPSDDGLLFLGLFTLAMGLVMSAVLLLRRESQLAHARASFVSSVSHELRTPLAQIRMFAEMLLLGRARTEAEQRRSVEIIDNEAKRLSHLVENVLQAARSERGTVHINPTDGQIAPIVRDATESFMALAEAKQIAFRMEMQENLKVSADADAVRHIVLNLLDNAAKYGPVGQRIVVGVALFEDAARLWVDDEGPGVPLRERERVFQAFYRSQRDLRSTTAGSGIGLAIVRELAGLHGGSAWIEDAPGGGARVVVEFPGAYVSAEQQSSDWAVA